MRYDPTQALSKPKVKKPKPNQACSCGSGKKYKRGSMRTFGVNGWSVELRTS